MMRYGIGAAFGAAAIAVLGAWSGTASAAPVSPGIAAAAAQANLGAEPVRWVCGPYRCHWQPGATVVVPGYAAAWGAPRYPWCYWSKVRGPYGGVQWVQVCKR